VTNVKTRIPIPVTPQNIPRPMGGIESVRPGIWNAGVVTASAAAMVADGALASLFAAPVGALSASAVADADAAGADALADGEEARVGATEGAASTGFVETASLGEAATEPAAEVGTGATLAEEPTTASAAAVATVHDCTSCMLPDPSVSGVRVTRQVSVINPWSVWYVFMVVTVCGALVTDWRALSGAAVTAPRKQRESWSTRRMADLLEPNMLLAVETEVRCELGLCTETGSLCAESAKRRNGEPPGQKG